MTLLSLKVCVYIYIYIERKSFCPGAFLIFFCIPLKAKGILTLKWLFHLLFLLESEMI